MEAKPKPWRGWLIFGALLAALVLATVQLEVDPLEIFTPSFWGALLRLLNRMTPDLNQWAGALDYTIELWPILMKTIKVAILTTFIGAVAGLPVAFLAARNVMSGSLRKFYFPVRGVLNFIRSIPDLALASLFVAAFGIGVLPGIMALSVFGFTLMIKLLSESIESVDAGPTEAIQAVGGNRLQQIGFALWPQIMPTYLSYALYTLELNVRASFVLGMVGAGGIGQVLLTDLHTFKYKQAFVIILVTLVAVVLVDMISTRLRERLL